MLIVGDKQQSLLRRPWPILRNYRMRKILFVVPLLVGENNLAKIEVSLYSTHASFAVSQEITECVLVDLN